MFGTSGSQEMEVVDLRFESLRDLQEEFGPYLSPEGFFLRDRSDFAASDVLRFRLMLPGEFVLVEGVGVVVWAREPGEATPSLPVGVAVGFATLSDQGRELVERIVHSHIESGGKPFNMSRPSDNGDPQDSLPEAAEVVGESRLQTSLKFTVREDSAPEADELDGAGDGELRLPFEEDVKPETDGGPEAERKIPDPAPFEALDDSVVREIGTEGHEAPELQEGREDSSQWTMAVGPGDSSEYEPEPDEAEPEGGLEISLPEEPPMTEGMYGSWKPEAEESVSSGRRDPATGRSGLVRILIGIAVLAAGAWAVWTVFPEYLPWAGGSPDAVIVEPDESEGEGLPAEGVAPLTDEDLEAAVEAAVDAMTAQEPVEEPEPKPTVVPVVADAVSNPGTRIVDIKADAEGSGTVVLIRADGAIESRRIRTSILPTPPRILVRISGIDSPFRPFEIPVGTAEIQGIRVGHHEETRPPSLWIVLDRADVGVEIQDTQTSGNVIRIEVGR
ncbi:MAG: hypothetical protein ABFS37_11380 [Acidobacteriota bacterium]